METKPTDLTDEQYNGAWYGVSDNGDTWLLYSSNGHDYRDECILLGHDPEAWKNLMIEIGEDNLCSADAFFEGEVIPVLVCDMSIRATQLDLDALRNGEVIWYAAM
jgi:hypothetical protein